VGGRFEVSGLHCVDEGLDVFAVQGTSRTSSDPFLHLTVPAGVHEIMVTVEDLALRGGALYGYRLMVRQQAEDFHLTVGAPQLNIPAGGTTLLNVAVDRRGFDGPIHLTIPDLPKGVRYTGFAVLALLWAGICWSRLSLAAHYPTDVAGGIMLGGAIALIGAAVVRLAGKTAPSA